MYIERMRAIGRRTAVQFSTPMNLIQRANAII